MCLTLTCAEDPCHPAGMPFKRIIKSRLLARISKQCVQIIGGLYRDCWLCIHIFVSDRDGVLLKVLDSAVMMV